MQAVIRSNNRVLQTIVLLQQQKKKKKDQSNPNSPEPHRHINMTWDIALWLLQSSPSIFLPCIAPDSTYIRKIIQQLFLKAREKNTNQREGKIKKKKNETHRSEGNRRERECWEVWVCESFGILLEKEENHHEEEETQHKGRRNNAAELYRPAL